MEIGDFDRAAERLAAAAAVADRVELDRIELLGLLVEAWERSDWKVAGARTPADWLASTTDLSHAAATRFVRLAELCWTHPALGDAVMARTLTLAQAEHLTRWVTRDREPDLARAIATLIRVADQGDDDTFRAAVRHWARLSDVRRGKAPPEQTHALYGTESLWGGGQVHGNLCRSSFLTLMAALEAFDSGPDPTDGPVRARTKAERRADALDDLAHFGLTHDPDDPTCPCCADDDRDGDHPTAPNNRTCDETDDPLEPTPTGRARPQATARSPPTGQAPTRRTETEVPPEVADPTRRSLSRRARKLTARPTPTPALPSPTLKTTPLPASNHPTSPTPRPATTQTDPPAATRSRPVAPTKPSPAAARQPIPPGSDASEPDEFVPNRATRRRHERVQRRHQRRQRRLRKRSGVTVNVTIDLQTLAGRELDDLDGFDLRSDHWRIGIDAAQRLLCDAGFVATLTDGRNTVLDASDRTEGFTAAQRRALAVRDRHCVFPGCTRPAHWCDAHHLEERHRGGPDGIDNGALLCRYHHRLLHEYGWSLELDEHDRWIAIDTRGTVWPGRPRHRLEPRTHREPVPA